MTDRRINPRVQTNLTAELRNRDGARRKVDLIDLSLNGFAVTGNNSLVEYLEVVNPQSGVTYFPVEITAEMSISRDGKETVQVQARQMYKRRLSQTSFQIGFRIIGYLNGSREHLLTYINDRLK